MSLWGRMSGIFAAVLGSVGLYFESTTFIIVATIIAAASAISWTRWTAPHDHWREFRKRRSWWGP